MAPKSRFLFFIFTGINNNKWKILGGGGGVRGLVAAGYYFEKGTLGHLSTHFITESPKDKNRISELTGIPLPSFNHKNFLIFFDIQVWLDYNGCIKFKFQL